MNDGLPEKRSKLIQEIEIQEELQSPGKKQIKEGPVLVSNWDWAKPINKSFISQSVQVLQTEIIDNILAVSFTKENKMNQIYAVILTDSNRIILWEKSQNKKKYEFHHNDFEKEGINIDYQDKQDINRKYTKIQANWNNDNLDIYFATLTLFTQYLFDTINCTLQKIATKRLSEIANEPLLLEVGSSQFCCLSREYFSSFEIKKLNEQTKPKQIPQCNLEKNGSPIFAGFMLNDASFLIIMQTQKQQYAEIFELKENGHRSSRKFFFITFIDMLYQLEEYRIKAMRITNNQNFSLLVKRNTDNTCFIAEWAIMQKENSQEFDGFFPNTENLTESVNDFCFSENGKYVWLAYQMASPTLSVQLIDRRSNLPIISQKCSSKYFEEAKETITMIFQLPVNWVVFVGSKSLFFLSLDQIQKKKFMLTCEQEYFNKDLRRQYPARPLNLLLFLQEDENSLLVSTESGIWTFDTTKKECVLKRAIEIKYCALILFNNLFILQLSHGFCFITANNLEYEMLIQSISYSQTTENLKEIIDQFKGIESHCGNLLLAKQSAERHMILILDSTKKSILLKKKNRTLMIQEIKESNLSSWANIDQILEFEPKTNESTQICQGVFQKDNSFQVQKLQRKTKCQQWNRLQVQENIIGSIKKSKNQLLVPITNQIIIFEFETLHEIRKMEIIKIGNGSALNIFTNSDNDHAYCVFCQPKKPALLSVQDVNFNREIFNFQSNFVISHEFNEQNQKLAQLVVYMKGNLHWISSDFQQTRKYLINMNIFNLCDKIMDSDQKIQSFSLYNHRISRKLMKAPGKYSLLLNKNEKILYNSTSNIIFSLNHALCKEILNKNWQNISIDLFMASFHDDFSWKSIVCSKYVARSIFCLFDFKDDTNKEIEAKRQQTSFILQSFNSVIAQSLHQKDWNEISHIILNILPLSYAASFLNHVFLKANFELWGKTRNYWNKLITQFPSNTDSFKKELLSNEELIIEKPKPLTIEWCPIWIERSFFTYQPTGFIFLDSLLEQKEAVINSKFCTELMHHLWNSHWKWAFFNFFLQIGFCICILLKVLQLGNNKAEELTILIFNIVYHCKESVELIGHIVFEMNKHANDDETTTCSKFFAFFIKQFDSFWNNFEWVRIVFTQVWFGFVWKYGAFHNQNYFDCALVLLNYFKAFEFLRISKNVQITILLIYSIIKVVIPFLCILFIFWIAFSLIFTQYTQFGRFGTGATKAFQIFFGTQDANELENATEWAFVVFAVILLQIIMMNLLISIMGDAFSKAKEDAKALATRELASLLFSLYFPLWLLWSLLIRLRQKLSKETFSRTSKKLLCQAQAENEDPQATEMENKKESDLKQMKDELCAINHILSALKENVEASKESIEACKVKMEERLEAISGKIDILSKQFQ